MWYFSTFLFIEPCIFLIKTIYIYSRPQTDGFVVSQIFSVARHVGRFKLGLNPAQLYVRFGIITLSHQLIYISTGMIRHYVVAFVCLHFALPDTRMLHSFEELCITWEAAVNSFARVLNSPEGERIYCHPQTDVFIVSQLFNVTRHVGCFKLGLKPTQLYVRLSIISLCHIAQYYID